MSSDDLILGIDLGTTFSLVAIADERGPRILRDENGEGRLPSVIAFHPEPDGTVRVTTGWEARRHAVEHPRTTIYSVKRLIGKGAEELQSEASFLAYAVRSGPRDTLKIEIGDRLLSPEEISSVLLRELRERAERELGHPVRKAVITVPAYFDDAQRQATRVAGEAAGLDVLRIINEPTAAALAYGFGLRDMAANESASADSASTGAQNVVIYDLGGGTFDVSVLRIEGGVFQVLATAGDTRLGGDDFDRRIIEKIESQARDEFGVAIDSPATRQALRTFAEAVKVRLSDAPQATLELDLGQGRVLRSAITREEFETRISELVERSVELCRRAMNDAGLTPGDVERFILVGGSTRVPLVRRRIAEAFGQAPYTALNPDEVVALGAALQASVLRGDRREMLLLDVIPLSLGIETLGGAMGKLILRNTTIPCRASEMFTTFVDGQTAIKVNVLQGERELAADCRRLAEFELRGLPPMPAGLPKVEVEFLVDANGILNVSAREQRSGVEASVQVIPNHGLTREEIGRITSESVIYAQADLQAHRRIDLVNQVEFDVQKTEQMLARYGDRLSVEERERIQADIARLREMCDAATDLNVLHKALTDFGHGTRRLAEIGIREALKSQ